jgi:hypothetical protein
MMVGVATDVHVGLKVAAAARVTTCPLFSDNTPPEGNMSFELQLSRYDDTVAVGVGVDVDAGATVVQSWKSCRSSMPAD